MDAQEWGFESMKKYAILYFKKVDGISDKVLMCFVALKTK